MSKNSKIVEWDVTLSSHQKPEYRWARISPCFKKGIISIVKNGLKAKVKAGATGNEIREAVQQRLKRAGEATNTPIQIS